ncbi:hypothetical protein [Paragemmobacter straminiformis]|uniref:Uncharacterized protein n=1 Tax=Paragemmobacter straminiformis TaxID=2045119 RepID=A0A842IF07_9RHOB|nr:hypothetical protein [Gemmobacter straminiformis]MBC2837627.1 hypothetical protein [Gemmobacter straminiformis]
MKQASQLKSDTHMRDDIGHYFDQAAFEQNMVDRDRRMKQKVFAAELEALGVTIDQANGNVTILHQYAEKNLK